MKTGTIAAFVLAGLSVILALPIYDFFVANQLKEPNMSQAHKRTRFTEAGFNGIALLPGRDKAPEKLVVLLHCYTCNATFMTGLARRYLTKFMPETAFYAPEGDKVPGDDDANKKQWWTIGNFGWDAYTQNKADVPEHIMQTHKKMADEIALKAGDLNSLVIELMDKHRLDAGDVYLFGLSQGAMTALEMAYMRLELAQLGEPLGGVVAIAGLFVSPWRETALKSGEDVMPAPAHLFHGTADHIVPFENHKIAMAKLQDSDVDVKETVISGHGHIGIEGAVGKNYHDELLAALGANGEDGK